MTEFYVDNWITALRGSVVRRVFGTHERIVVFGSEHGEYSNTINFHSQKQKNRVSLYNYIYEYMYDNSFQANVNKQTESTPSN